MAVGRQSLVQRRLESGELAPLVFVLRHGLAGCLEPFLDRVARQSGALCDLAEESWSRSFMRLTQLIMSMVITLNPC
jgi:hypothetical protein